MTFTLSTAEETQAFGRSWGQRLQAGDLLVLTGDLGAGKTTFTQGLAEGLGVRGPIPSPTYVIARVHPSLTDGPGLVHVDAYRLGQAAELDDVDLDDTMAESVTVVEWGKGLAEHLAGEGWVEIILERTGNQDGAEDVRTAIVHGHGPRGLALVRPG